MAKRERNKDEGREKDLRENERVGYSEKRAREREKRRLSGKKRRRGNGRDVGGSVG